MIRTPMCQTVNNTRDLLHELQGTILAYAQGTERMPRESFHSH